MGTYAFRVGISYSIGSKQGTNTWHVRTPSTPIPGPLSLSDIIKTFYTSLGIFFPSDMSFNYDGTLTEVGSETPALIGGITSWNVVGTATSGSYGPAGVGLCVGWRSSLANKKGRGRTFLAPLALNAFSPDGTLVDARITTVRASAAALVASSVADGNGAIVVWSPSSGTTGVARDVVSSKVNDRVAWLSSRRS
jgi:hypothetical protein